MDKDTPDNMPVWQFILPQQNKGKYMQKTAHRTGRLTALIKEYSDMRPAGENLRTVTESGYSRKDF